MEETIDTGVIYVVTNSVNNKKYVGKANSFVKHVRNPNYRHGTEGRFKRHLSNAKQGNNEIPLLYDEIRNYGSNNFKVDTLEICLKDDLKNREHYHILNLQTYKENIGYNFFRRAVKQLSTPVFVITSFQCKLPYSSLIHVSAGR